jgi:hypothetical protein
MKKIIYKKTEKEIFGNMTLFVSSNKSILGLNKGIRWMTLKNIDIYNFLINITDKNEIDPIKTTDYYYILSAVVALGGLSFLIVKKVNNDNLARAQEEEARLASRPAEQLSREQLIFEEDIVQRLERLETIPKTDPLFQNDNPIYRIFEPTENGTVDQLLNKLLDEQPTLEYLPVLIDDFFSAAV